MTLRALRSEQLVALEHSFDRGHGFVPGGGVVFCHPILEGLEGFETLGG